MQYIRTVTHLRSQLKYTTRLELMILHQHISYTEHPSISTWNGNGGSEQVLQLKDTSEAHIEFIYVRFCRLYYSFSDVGGEGRGFSLI
jgi:hypothetical protein